MIEPSELIEVLECFFIETPEILNQCDQAISSSDYALLKKLFHSLKGSTSNLHLEILSQLAAELEGRAESKDLTFVSNHTPALRNEFFAFMEKFKNHFSR